jgi:hypothetical protein
MLLMGRKTDAHERVAHGGRRVVVSPEPRYGCVKAALLQATTAEQVASVKHEIAALKVTSLKNAKELRQSEAPESATKQGDMPRSWQNASAACVGTRAVAPASGSPCATRAAQVASLVWSASAQLEPAMQDASASR